MMHVMQPVVLDTGWSTTHSAATTSPSTASSCVTADVTAVNRTAASAGLSGGGMAVNGVATMVPGSRPQTVDAAAFNTLNHVDVCHDQSLAANSRPSSTANPPAVDSPLKPPKKPLTPYMRFSKAVSCCIAVLRRCGLLLQTE